MGIWGTRDYLDDLAQPSLRAVCADLIGSETARAALGAAEQIEQRWRDECNPPHGSGRTCEHCDG